MAYNPNHQLYFTIYFVFDLEIILAQHNIWDIFVGRYTF